MTFKEIVKERLKELDTELLRLKAKYPKNYYNKSILNCEEAYRHNKNILFLIEQYEKYGLPKSKIPKTQLNDYI